MFQRLLNSKPSAESAPIAAQTLVEEPESDLHVLKNRRAAIEAEIEVLAGQHDKATESLRELRKKAKPSGWHDLNYKAAQIFPDTPQGRALSEAADRSNQLRTALDEKAAELERVTKLIHAIEREVPGRLRRETLEAAMPLVFEMIDALAAAASHEAEFVRLGGQVEHPIPWELMLAGGERIELETVVSRWLRALKREGISIPGDISDNALHLPAPASAHARVQTDIGHTIHAARRGGGGYADGFRDGYMTRAR